MPRGSVEATIKEVRDTLKKFQVSRAPGVSLLCPFLACLMHVPMVRFENWTGWFDRECADVRPQPPVVCQGLHTGRLRAKVAWNGCKWVSSWRRRPIGTRVELQRGCGDVNSQSQETYVRPCDPAVFPLWICCPSSVAFLIRPHVRPGRAVLLIGPRLSLFASDSVV